MKKVNKEEIMKRIREAGDPENYVTTWDENGVPKSKKKSNVKKGKNAKARGARFELSVRKDLEEKGWIVDKWTNNIDLDEEPVKISPAKRKYNPFRRAMTIGTGFPDFVTIKNVSGEIYSVEGVEVKMNGMLSKVEKEKCAWYLQNRIFSEIWIAKKGGKRGEIEYVNFREKYGKKFGLRVN
jgi:hypothetical protein